MKKWLVLALTATLLVSLVGCKTPFLESQGNTSEEDAVTTERENSDTQDESNGTSDEKVAVLPEDIVAAFMALCEENNGFDMKIAWVTGKSVRLGGKDNVFWYEQLPGDGSRSLMVGKLVDGTWSDIAYAFEGDGVLSADVGGQLTIQTAAGMAYGQQIYFTSENATTAMVQHQGFDCTRYEGMLGLTIDVVKQFGVTARYLAPNDDDTYSLLYIKTGDDAAVPEIPEAKKTEDIDSAEYWDSIYGVNICPFSIVVNGEEHEYKFRNGGDLYTWLYTEMNVDGWYQLDDKVISKDGKWVIESPDSFSSFCTYEAQPYSGATLTEDEQTEVKKGHLYAIHSWTPFCVNYDGNGFVFLGKMAEDAETTISNLPTQFKAEEEVKIAKAGYDQDFEGTLRDKCVLYVFSHKAFSEYKVALSEEMIGEAIVSANYTLLTEEDKSDFEQPRFTFTIPEGTAIGDVDFVFTFDGVVAYVMECEIVE